MKTWIEKLDAAGVALVAGTLVVWSVQSVWSVYQTVIAAAGGVMILAALAAKRDRIRAGLGRRSTRYGANSATSVVLLLGVLGIINYLAVQHAEQFDLTAERIYSLSEQSLAVADQIGMDVRIRAFYPGGDDPGVRDLLELYNNRNSRISFEFVDPDRQPQLAEQFNVTVYGASENPLTGASSRFGTVILSTEGFEERIETDTEPLREEHVTNALMRLAKGERKKIYVVEGHGEKSITGTEPGGMDAARSALERENYVVETLNLVRTEAVPDDAAVLVWAGPETEPFPQEIEQVNAYLERGGSVLVMLDPPPAPGLEGLLSRWSVDVGSNFVVDASGVGRLLGAGPEIPLVTDYGAHPVTDPLVGTMTFFQLARTVSPAEGGSSDNVVTELLRTSPRSWGESGGFGEVTFDASQDIEGPTSLGVAVTRDLESADAAQSDEAAPADDASANGSSDSESTPNRARLVVFGDSDFASNAFFGQAGNRNLFLNAVTWLAEDESFISIRPKTPGDRPLTLTASEGRISLYLSIVVLPLAIVATGISVWMKRRGR